MKLLNPFLTQVSPNIESCSLYLAVLTYTALYLFIYFIPAVHILPILLNYTDETICNLTDLVHSKFFLLK